MSLLSKLRKNKFLPLLSTVVLFLGVLTGVFLVQQQQDLQTSIQATPAPGPSPANPNASLDTRKVLNYLSCLPKRSENRVISGHFIRAAERAPSGYKDFVVSLYDQTGKWVARIETDYTKTGGDGSTSISDVNPTLIDYWNNGGLVGMIWDPGNPYGGTVRDNKERVNIDQILTPGSSVNRIWMEKLDTAAVGLAELRDAGVVVLWRPFHEMNGGWFWWSWDKGERISPAQYTRLWRYMFDYFTYDKGLNNILWIYSPDGQESNPPPSWEKPVMYYYPGDAYVDIVAWDVYDDNLVEYGYDDLLATGKPIMFGEQGPGRTRNGTWDNTILIKAIRERYPETTSFTAWSSWEGNIISLVENQNAAELLNDPWVITREELNWREADAFCPLAPSPSPVPPPSGETTTPTPPPPPGTNLIANPSFEEGTQNWLIFTDGVGAFTTSSPAYDGGSSAKVAITTEGNNVQLYQKGINLEPNTQYKLSFAAFSNTGHDLEVKLHKHGEPYTNYGLNTTLDLGTTWKTFNFDFTTNDLGGGVPVADARLRFWLAPYDADGDEYFIDAVSLTKTSTTCTLTGDVNCDGVVNILDFQLLNNLFGTNNPDADLNGDGIVNILDFQILSNNFGKTGG